MKNIDKFILLIFGFIAGLVIMYLYIQPRLIYQGKTAQQWSALARSNDKLANIMYAQAKACRVDPSSVACTPAYGLTKLGNSLRKCTDAIKDAGDIVWHYNNCQNITPTPLSIPNVDNESQNTPESCQSAISTNGHYLGQICGGVLIGPNGQ